MSQCPGCKISYCLDCEKSVEPNVYRCEECRVEYDRRDPFAQSALENGVMADKWKRAARAAKACLAYMSQERKSKEEGDRVAAEYNEAWKAAEEWQKVTHQ